MIDLNKLEETLTRHGFTVHRFATAQAAADFVDAAIDSTCVGFGGSRTLDELELYQRLGTHNTVFSHGAQGLQILPQAAQAPVYLTSVNALAQTGELINIDGRGNRVASTLYGHEEVWFLVGQNKLAPTYEAALWRARNIAGPKNAQRLGRKTPCALRGDRCYDCDSPERICAGLVTLWRKPEGIDTAHVVLIEEDLGM